MKNKENMFVTFFVDDEYCGISIDHVISIEKNQKKTRVPNGPSYVEGIINLRGEVIAVIDLRSKLNLKFKEPDEDSRIIIVSYDELKAGLLVDSSSDVIELSSDYIDNPPISEENENYKYISAIGKTKKGLITLLDLEKILER